MNYLITFLIFGLCFLGMAIGLIFAKKTLKKGCSLDPDSCICQKENKDPSDCDKKTPRSVRRIFFAA
ncbi:MAG: Na(+)-translocating NADH-quinone reductase subunit E [Candidatus Omnitrophica bacterium]|nr:Na(+)-translocating NADH-quinone reductase subunit E [Candidatus Omnitrophota bacterium]